MIVFGRAQVADGLEQRHDDEVELGAGALAARQGAPHQPALLLQDEHLQEIAHALGVADDVVADGLGAEVLPQPAGLLEDGELSSVASL